MPLFRLKLREGGELFDNKKIHFTTFYKAYLHLYNSIQNWAPTARVFVPARCVRCVYLHRRGSGCVVADLALESIGPPALVLGVLHE
jgi:hypothetical protein